MCSDLALRLAEGLTPGLVVQLIQEGGLFGGHVPPALAQEWALKTPLTAKMHEDTTLMRGNVAAVLEQFGLPSWRVSYWERLQVSLLLALHASICAAMS